MTKQEYIGELEFVLETDSGELNEETQLNGLPGWDSTGQLGLVALLDEMGVQASVVQIRDCKTVSDLIRLAGGAVN